MMDKLIELNNNGLRVSSKEEIKDYLKRAISEAYGTDINFNTNYPDGIVVEAISTVIRDTFESIQGLYNSFNIRNCSGVILDNLSNLINIYRKSKTQASGDLRITLTANKVYDIRKMVIRDQNNNLWTNRERTVQDLSGKSDMIITKKFTCDNYGIVDLPTSFVVLEPADSTGLVIEPILENFVQGENDEDDISLRHRVMNTPINNSVAVKEILIKQILDNKYVKNVKLYNNDTDSTKNLKLKKNKEGVTGDVELPISQLAIIIQYNRGLLPSIEEEIKIVKDAIGEIIKDYKGLCAITLNPQEQLLINNYYAYEHDSNRFIYFIEAQEKKDVEITIDILKGINYNDAKTKNYVKSLVCSYLSTLGIGEDLIPGNLMSYLYENADKQFMINNIILSGNSGTNNDEYYPTEIKTGSLNIAVTVNGV